MNNKKVIIGLLVSFWIQQGFCMEPAYEKGTAEYEIRYPEESSRLKQLPAELRQELIKYYNALYEQEFNKFKRQEGNPMDLHIAEKLYIPSYDAFNYFIDKKMIKLDDPIIVGNVVVASILGALRDQQKLNTIKLFIKKQAIKSWDDIQGWLIGDVVRGQNPRDNIDLLQTLIEFAPPTHKENIMKNYEGLLTMRPNLRKIDAELQKEKMKEEGMGEWESVSKEASEPSRWRFKFW